MFSQFLLYLAVFGILICCMAVLNVLKKWQEIESPVKDTVALSSTHYSKTDTGNPFWTSFEQTSQLNQHLGKDMHKSMKNFKQEYFLHYLCLCANIDHKYGLKNYEQMLYENQNNYEYHSYYFTN